MIATTESSVTDRDRHGPPAAPRQGFHPGVGRVARWVACAAVAACALVGAAAPAQAIGDTVPVPSAPPTRAPATGLLPRSNIEISAELQYGLRSVPTKGYQTGYNLHTTFMSAYPGEDMTQQECQELVDTFWSGGGDDYYAEASYWSTFCEIDAYYMGEARHAFYSVDEAGHLQVRGPMAYLNQIASSFENAEVTSFLIDFTGVNNARCNANPTHEKVDDLIVYVHRTVCEWDIDKGGVMPTSDDPLIEGDIEQAFFDDDNGTVGPFVDPVAPINPFTITPPPTTNPAADPSATGGHDTSTDSSSTGLLIGIGAAVAALLLVAAGALVVALRRK